MNYTGGFCGGVEELAEPGNGLGCCFVVVVVEVLVLVNCVCCGCWLLPSSSFEKLVSRVYVVVDIVHGRCQVVVVVVVESRVVVWVSSYG